VSNISTKLFQQNVLDKKFNFQQILKRFINIEIVSKPRLHGLRFIGENAHESVSIITSIELHR
jgi:hypothetical protein